MSIAKKSTTSQAKKILVVDDQGEIGLLLNIVLSEMDLEVDYVNNLEETEKYLSANQPAAILLDNKLPDGFGIDFTSHIKRRYPEVRVIMVSGFPGAHDVALENGADLFIEKPFTAKQIQEAIRSVLEIKKEEVASL